MINLLLLSLLIVCLYIYLRSSWHENLIEIGFILFWAVAALGLYGPVADFLNLETIAGEGFGDAIAFDIVTLVILLTRHAAKHRLADLLRASVVSRSARREWRPSSDVRVETDGGTPEETPSRNILFLIVKGLGKTVLACIPAFAITSFVALCIALTPVSLSPAIGKQVQSSALVHYLVQLTGPFGPNVTKLVVAGWMDTSNLIKRGETAWDAAGKKGLADEEWALYSLVNDLRIKSGLHPVGQDFKVREEARRFAEELARQDYFSHKSVTHGSLDQRLKSADVSFGRAGENLSAATDATAAFDGLMRSPHHRENILRSGYRQTGIGVARSSDGEQYVYVEIFTD